MSIVANHAPSVPAAVVTMAQLPEWLPAICAGCHDALFVHERHVGVTLCPACAASHEARFDALDRLDAETLCEQMDLATIDSVEAYLDAEEFVGRA